MKKPEPTIKQKRALLRLFRKATHSCIVIDKDLLRVISAIKKDIDLVGEYEEEIKSLTSKLKHSRIK